MNQIEAGGEERRGKWSEMLCISFLHNEVIFKRTVRGIKEKCKMKFISLFFKYLYKDKIIVMSNFFTCFSVL